jgi:hypothetical protein
MRQELADLAGQYDAALARLHALVTALPAEAWGRRPAAGGWSPAECIAHLNLTSTAFVPILHAGLEDARRLGAAAVVAGASPAPGRLSRDALGWVIAQVSGPSRRFKSKTQAAFVPTAGRPPGELVAEFERLQADHLACVRAADGLPIHRVKVPSPFEARLRYSLYSALTLIPGHQQRHLLQAELAGGLAPRL